MTRHAHRRPALVAVVALGGSVGAGARYELGRVLTPAEGWPIGTLAANLLGAFLLGVLLEVLLRRGEETGRGRVLRLGLGTGLLGGFTTFSSVALELERLLADGAATTALGYAAITLVLGFVACLAGVVLAARHHAWRFEPDRGDTPAAPGPAPATEDAGGSAR